MALDATHERHGDDAADAPHHSGKPEPAVTPTLMLAALGIVYGDLGTSPLYTLQTMVGAAAATVDATAALGIFSLVFWALIITVSSNTACS